MDGLNLELGNDLPICVDLDGTLIRNDVTMIALKCFLKQRFWNVFLVIWWFFHGRARLKYELSKFVKLDFSKLDYNIEFLNFLKKKKNDGNHLFLATACNEKYAFFVADYLKIFDGIFASDINNNLRADNKANKLVSVFGEKKFVYAGNSKDDLKVWRHAAQIIIVAPAKNVLKELSGKEFILFL